MNKFNSFSSFSSFLSTNITDVIVDVDKIEEAVKRNKKLPNGGTVADLLQDLYNYGEKQPWTTKEVANILSNYGLDTKARGNLLFALKKDGTLDSPSKGKYSITADTVDELGLDKGSKSTKTTKPQDKPEEALENSETSDGSKKINSIKRMGTTKLKKFIVPTVGKNSKYMDQMKTILSHMSGVASGDLNTSFMLAGDPGCIIGETELEIEMSDELYTEFLSFMEGRD